MKRRYPKRAGAMLLAAGIWLCAAPDLSRGEAADIPVPARVVLAKAGDLIRRSHVDEALETLLAFQAGGGEADAPDPRGRRHPEVAFAIGTCHLVKEDYRAAARAFEKALAKGPGHVAAWLNLARAAHGLGDDARAAEAFAKAYDHGADPRPEHLFYSATAWLMAGETATAVTAFERLFRRHPDHATPAWRENFVHALITAGRPREALPHIRVLAETGDGDHQVRWQELLLHHYLELDLREEARAYAEKLTREAPTRAGWWKALAHICLAEKEYPGALAALTIAGYLEPPSGRELKLLADLHLQVGIPLKAVPLYEAVLQEGYDPRLLYHLALALQQLGRFDEALAALERFAPENPSPDFAELKSHLLAFRGQSQGKGMPGK